MPILTEDTCAMAWDMISPSIAYSADMTVTNKYAGCIVVYNEVGQAIFVTTINGQEEDAKYVEIAHAKAQVSMRTGMTSSEVQTQYPYLYENGDTKWGGSTIMPGGVVIAFSGVQAVYDEMISEWMASTIRALCRNEMTRPGGVMESDSSFINV